MNQEAEYTGLENMIPEYTDEYKSSSVSDDEPSGMYSVSFNTKTQLLKNL